MPYTSLARQLIAIAIALTLARAIGAAELQISTENTPEHIQTRHMVRFAEALNQRISGHHVSVVHSAAAFNGRDVVSALSTGKVAMAAPGIWHLGRFVSDIDVLTLPYFMGLDGDELHPLVDGPIGREINRQLEQRLDVVVFGTWLDLGPAHVFTLTKPVTSFADLQGMRIRFPGSAGNATALTALGAKPVYIPWPDTPLALDLREVDGLLTTASTAASAQLWRNGIRHAFLSHSYFPFYIPMISRQIWNRLDADERIAIRNTWRSLIDDGRRLAASDQKQALRELEAAGVSIVSPPSTERATMRNELLAHQQQIATEIGIGPNMLDLLHSANRKTIDE